MNYDDTRHQTCNATVCNVRCQADLDSSHSLDVRLLYQLFRAGRLKLITKKVNHRNNSKAISWRY